MRRSELPSSPAESFALLKADYQATKPSRFRRTRRGLAPGGASADWHYRSEADYLKLLEWSRDFDRNDLMVGEIVTRGVDNTLSGGFTLDPQTGDRGLDRELFARWEDWANEPAQCDLSHEHTIHQQARLICRALKVDGDQLAICFPEERAVQLVEAHRVRSPQREKVPGLVHGVQLDGQRRRVAYWLTRDDVGVNAPVQRLSELHAYPTYDEHGVRQVLHVLNPKRATQTRGVSAFAPIFDALGMFEDVNFSLLVKQVMCSAFAILRERPLDWQEGDDPQRGERRVETLSDGSSRVVEGVAPGMEIRGRPGEKLTGFSPNIPSQETMAHLRMILQFLCVNLGVPLCAVMLDGSETNFSGWRGALDQAKFGWRYNQGLLIGRFYKPLYVWYLAQLLGDPGESALRQAAQRLGRKFLAHAWHTPKWPYIEPQKDEAALIAGVANGTRKIAEVAAQHGQDTGDYLREIVRERLQAVGLAFAGLAQLERKYPAAAGQVHWRDLMPLPIQQGVQVALGPEPAAASEEQPAEKTPAKIGAKPKE